MSGTPFFLHPPVQARLPQVEPLRVVPGPAEGAPDRAELGRGLLLDCGERKETISKNKQSHERNELVVVKRKEGEKGGEHRLMMSLC